jgi:uncharacterized membrane protein
MIRILSLTLFGLLYVTCILGTLLLLFLLWYSSGFGALGAESEAAFIARLLFSDLVLSGLSALFSFVLLLLFRRLLSFDNKLIRRIWVIHFGVFFIGFIVAFCWNILMIIGYDLINPYPYRQGSQAEIIAKLLFYALLISGLSALLSFGLLQIFRRFLSFDNRLTRRICLIQFGVLFVGFFVILFFEWLLY